MGKKKSKDSANLRGGKTEISGNVSDISDLSNKNSPIQLDVGVNKDPELVKGSMNKVPEGKIYEFLKNNPNQLDAGVSKEPKMMEDIGDVSDTSDFSKSSENKLEARVAKDPELVQNNGNAVSALPLKHESTVELIPEDSRNDICGNVSDTFDFSKNSENKLEARVTKDPELIEKNGNAVPALPLKHESTAESEPEDSGKDSGGNVSDASDFSKNTENQLEAGVTKYSALIEKNDNAAPVLPHKCESTVESEPGDKASNTCQENASDSSHYFAVDIPRIGKNFFPDTDDKPFVGRYDLARKVMEARCQQSLKERDNFPTMNFHEMMRIKNSRTNAEKKAEEAKNRRRDQKTAIRLTKLGICILKMLEKEDFDEQQLEACFDYFLDLPFGPSCLLYVPHVVHTIMHCRSERDLLSRRLRSKADECFQKCHSMFAVPVGLNFESVYTAQVRRLSLPPEFHKLLDEHPLDYEDFSEDESESGFSESSPSSQMNDFDEESSSSVRSG